MKKTEITDHANRLKIEKNDEIVIVNFFEVNVFLLLSLDSGPSFTSMPSLLLELRNFFMGNLTRNVETENNPA